MKSQKFIYLVNLLLMVYLTYDILFIKVCGIRVSNFLPLIMTKISTKLINRSTYMLPMSKESIRCPYCESLFNNNEELSKHIDRIHLGSGLLEGDSSKF